MARNRAAHASHGGSINETDAQIHAHRYVRGRRAHHRVGLSGLRVHHEVGRLLHMSRNVGSRDGRGDPNRQRRCERHLQGHRLEPLRCRRLGRHRRRGQHRARQVRNRNVPRCRRWHLHRVGRQQWRSRRGRCLGADQPGRTAACASSASGRAPSASSTCRPSRPRLQRLRSSRLRLPRLLRHPSSRPHRRLRPTRPLRSAPARSRSTSSATARTTATR